MATGISTAIIYIRMVDTLSGPLGGLAGKIANIGATISQVGLAMTATLTLPIIAALGASGKLAVDFDKAMKSIQTISKQTDSEIKNISQDILKMSTDIKQTVDSPTELAQALYEINSAAFYGTDALKILTVVSQAATGGLAKTKDVAVAVSKTLHAYGANASEATHFTDVMLRSVDVGIYHFADLAQSMGQFITTAGMAKIPIEEVFTAVATLTDKGLDLAEASTGINRFMLEFIKPSPKAAEAARQLGIDFSGETLSALGLTGALKLVYERTGMVAAITAMDKDGRLAAIDAQITQTKTAINFAASQGRGTAALKNQLAELKLQRSEITKAKFDMLDYDAAINAMAKSTGRSTSVIAALFPDVRAMRTAFGLLSDGLALYDENLIAISNSAGTVAFEYGKMTQSFDAQIKSFKNIASVAGITLGNELLPMLLTVAQQGLVPLIQKFIDLDAPIKRSIVSFAILAAAAGPALLLLGGLISALGGIVGAVVGVLGFIFSPLGIITILIVILGKAWLDNWNGMRDSLNEAYASMEPTLAKIINWLGVAIPKAANMGQVGIRQIGEQLALIGKTPFEKKQLELKQTNELLNNPNLILFKDSKSIAGLQKQAQDAFAYINDVKAAMRAYLQLQDEMSHGNATAMGAADLEVRRKWLIEQLGTIDPSILLHQVTDLGDKVASAAIPVGEAAKDVGKWLVEQLGIGIGEIGPSVLAAAQNLMNQLMATMGQKVTVGQMQIAPGIFVPSSTTTPTGLAATIATMPAVTLPDSQAWLDFANQGNDATDNIVQNFDKGLSSAATKFSSLLSEGISASKGLGDLLKLPGGGGIEAGANGPFEDIYRLQDVAMATIRGVGSETDKWMKKFGKTPEQAQAIIKKFQMGLFDEEVMQYIDTTKLINLGQMQMAAEASQKALVAKLTGSGLSQDVAAALIGFGKDTVPTIPLTQVQSAITTQAQTLTPNVGTATALFGFDNTTMTMTANNAIRAFLAAFDASLISWDGAIQDSGKQYWAIFAKGLETAAGTTKTPSLALPISPVATISPTPLLTPPAPTIQLPTSTTVIPLGTEITKQVPITITPELSLPAIQASLSAQAKTLLPDTNLAMLLMGFGKDQSGAMLIPQLPLTQIQNALAVQAQTLTPNTAITNMLFGFDTKAMALTTDSATRNLLTAFDNSLIAYDGAIRDSGKRYWNVFQTGLVEAATAPGGGLYGAVYGMMTNIIATELK